MQRARRHISLVGLIAILIIVGAVVFVGFAVVGQLLGPVLSGPCIAEVVIDYPIVDKGSDPDLLSTEPVPSASEVVSLINDAEERPDVAAIVLKIDSPGGEVIATREVYESVKKSDKPVVAYLRNIATSGGYYVAAGSDYIISEPETITGSIGVRATFISLEGLFSRIGINYTTVATGDKKDMGDVGRNLTAEERAIVEDMLSEIFQEFRDVVVKNRKGNPRFSEKKLDSVLDARIMSGRRAYSLGLVDELGNEDRAYEKAAELAGIDPNNYRKCELSPKKGFLRMFMEEVASPFRIRLGAGDAGPKVSVSYS